MSSERKRSRKRSRKSTVPGPKGRLRPLDTAPKCLVSPGTGTSQIYWPVRQPMAPLECGTSPPVNVCGFSATTLTRYGHTVCPAAENRAQQPTAISPQPVRSPFSPPSHPSLTQTHLESQSVERGASSQAHFNPFPLGSISGLECLRSHCTDVGLVRSHCLRT